LKINQDAPNQGKQHYFPWITCDPDNGNLAVIFYDDRNVPDNMCETWVAVSKNSGISWQDFRVGDAAFTPVPLTGFSDNYFGDYLGITSKGGMVYPCWTDNRTGQAMGYVSPFRIGPPPGQPYIDYYTHLVNDSLSGNNNSRAESGETFALSLSMRNIGDQPDSSVVVTLSCESPLVQIINGSQSFGDFDAAQTKNMPEAFLVRFSDSIPDNEEVVFTLSAKDSYDSTYLSSLVIRPHAPHLIIGPMFVIDTAGNNNNQPDPGESVILASVLTNTGDFTVAAAISRLSTSQAFCQIVNPVVVSEPIAPGGKDTISWHVTIDPALSAGTSAGFMDSLSYSGQEVQKLFVKKIGVLTEDWESGDLSRMAWKTGGGKPWNINNFMVYEGTYSMRSGYIKGIDTSSLFIALNLASDDSISFYRKVSSELYFDFLNFYIDDALVGQWSGEKDWAQVTFPVPAGKHTVKWKYIKDEGLSVGYDAAWIDFIEFPVQQRTTADAGPDARICGGSSFQADATATFYQSLAWSATGSGLFNDPSRIDAVYYPSPSDLEAGSLQLILTIVGFSFGETVKDTLVLTLAPKPTVNAGPDTFTCTGDVFTTSAAATNYLSTRWSTPGDGVFSQPDSLQTEYLPGSTDLHNKKVNLILKINPETVCPQLYDTLRLNIYAGFSASLIGDTTICRGDTAFLRLSLSGQGPWRVYLNDGSILTFLKPFLSIPVAPAFTTAYQVDSIINLNGCTFRSVLSTTVQVLQPPELMLQGPAESCQGKQIIIQAEADSTVEIHWMPGEAITSFITPVVLGNTGETVKYNVRVTDKSGCSASDSLLVKIVSDCVDKKAGDMDVKFYPNPTNGDFTLLLSSAIAESADIQINTIDNKVVYALENVTVFGIKQQSINLKSLAQGTYILQVRCGSGELRDKLVIKK
jgi:hypothetical protein